MSTQSEAIENKERIPFLIKMKEKWGLANIWQVIVVMIVFSLTGITAVAIRRWLFKAIGMPDDATWYFKTVVWLILITPTYQILLVAYGALFGQFRFFWEKEKKMLRAMKRLFTKKSK